MKKLEIEIPNDKEVDWEASAKQKQIVLKDKQLTYEDVCKKLFEKTPTYYTDSNGVIYTFAPKHHPALLKSPNNATSEHQLKCLLAKNKLANVARYLNGEWSKEELEICPSWTIFLSHDFKRILVDKVTICSEQTNVLFKYKELAQQAIEILGEETIKLALEPLY